MGFIASICFVNSGIISPPGNNSITGASGGAASIDTTGATALLALIRCNGGSGASPLIKDSASNTWTISSTFATTGATRIALAWCFNPTTSATHTFDTTALEGSGEVYAFNGEGTWSAENILGATIATSGTSVVTGSIGVQTGDIAIAGISSNQSLSTGTMDNSFQGGGNAQFEIALAQELSGSPEVGMSGYLSVPVLSTLTAGFATSAGNSDWTWAIGNFRLTPPAGSGNLVLDGDSITVGVGAVPYQTALDLTVGNWGITNIALAGESLATMLENIPDSIVPLFESGAPFNIDVVWGGTNDLEDGALPSDVIVSLQDYCEAARSAGYKVIVCTMISRVGLDVQKDEYNALIREQWSGFADGLADVAANPNLGEDNAYTNPTYFQGDGTHPTTFSQQTIIGPIIGDAVNALAGSFSISGNCGWPNAKVLFNANL